MSPDHPAAVESCTPGQATLVVFDSAVDEARISHDSAVDLFSLSTNAPERQRLQQVFQSRATVLDSARLIDEEVRRMRTDVPLWSAALGQLVVEGRRLVDWFMLSDGMLSAWWFNALAEKNPLKTDLFLHLAQLHAVVSLLQTGRYSTLVLVAEAPTLRAAMSEAARRLQVRVVAAHRGSQPLRGSLRTRIGRWLRAPNPFAEIVFGAISTGYLFARALRTRRVLAPLRKPTLPGDLMVSFWFPADAPPGGPVTNRYFEPLRGLAASHGRALNWLSFYLPTNGFSHSEAVHVARRAIDAGEPLFLAEEFVSFGGLWAALAHWCRLVLTYWRVSRFLQAGQLTDPFFVREATPLIRNAMRASCLGASAVFACWHHELAKSVAVYFSGVVNCVYPAENHGWERSLNAALSRFSPSIRRIGFQHTVVAKSHFFYRFAGTEGSHREDPGGIAHPDAFVVNGQGHYAELRASEYPGFQLGEALRHLPLKARFDVTAPAKSEPTVVLIAGGTAEAETMALLCCCGAALESLPGLELRFAPHPLLSPDVLQRALGFHDTRIRVDARTTQRAIEDASIVVVATTSVWLDALAAGCRVAAVALPEALFADPFVGEPPSCRAVYTADELASVVKDWAANPLTPGEISAAQQYVRGYWQLDESLPRWRKLLYQQDGSRGD